MLATSSVAQRGLYCVAVAGMLGALLCAAHGWAAEDVFQPTKPHVNIGTLAIPQRAVKTSAVPARGQTLVAALPDLRVREFQFVPGNVKSVRVRVVNTGVVAANKNRLRLTVRKIDGVSVGRMKFAVVPILAPGSQAWILIDADSILPNNVKLKATTFRLDVDATKLVSESNETNNLKWHNL